MRNAERPASQSVGSVLTARPGMPWLALLGSQRPLSHENVDGIPAGQLHLLVCAEVHLWSTFCVCVRAGAPQLSSAGGEAMFYEYASISKSVELGGRGKRKYSARGGML